MTSSSDKSLASVPGWEVIELQEIDSTNAFVMRVREHLQHDRRVIYAHTQTHGKGRMGREYVSLPGRHLTFSLVLHPELPRNRVQVIALLAGIAVARTLETWIDGVRLKWPNDVLVHGRKICGILLESTSLQGFRFPVLVMGIGINTEGSADDFPEPLSKTVTTLEEQLGGAADQPAVFRDLLHKLSEVLMQFQKEGLKSMLDEWLRRAKIVGQRVRCLNGKSIDGIFRGLTAEGYPEIITDNGEIHIHFSGDMLELGEE